MKDLSHLTSWDSKWQGLKVLVTGLGVAGFSCADTLLELGAKVTVFDANALKNEKTSDRAQTLKIIGGVLLTDEKQTKLAISHSEFDLIVTSPGWPPHHELFQEAQQQGIPIWGDVELAWRVRERQGKKTAQWLIITGTNGKTTTTGMLESILQHAGLKAIAAGNIGTPILDAIREPVEYDVFACELSSFQLHWSQSISAEAAVVLNIAPDHIDWHGSQEEYALAKAKAYHQVKIACVYNVEDPVTRQMVENADVQEGARAIGFTKGSPAVGMLGVVGDVLCDRAFLKERRTSALELAKFEDLGKPLAPHTVTNALAAAALARAIDVPPAAVQAGLHNYRAGGHRMEHVATVNGIDWVNDSKATNPHAAAASLAAFDNIIWVAGGLPKGAQYQELISSFKNRLKAVILIGKDKTPLQLALQKEAPELPVYDTKSSERQDIMPEVIELAQKVAQSGDTVLLAPAAASMDQFESYEDRGNSFVQAIAHIKGE
ncbi:MAG: UDP-N-acetylmuramoyl-L-alanine--D-glutamate ligase [Micrococcaceae bacterium]